MIDTETTLTEKKTGDVYAKMVGSAFYVGQGNWGGPKGPSTVNYPPPEGKRPDAVHTLQTDGQTAHLYRLNGDYNPLHATPEPGQRMGFGGAIMHGLFSWNAACHGLLLTLGNSDPANIREYQARFAAPVRPGDKLVTEVQFLFFSVSSCSGACWVYLLRAVYPRVKRLTGDSPNRRGGPESLAMVGGRKSGS